MDWFEMLKGLAPVLGEEAVKALCAKLNELMASADEPWKKTMLSLVENAVAEHGVDGIQIALAAIERLLDNKTPKIDWANLRVASDLLAQMQNAEAGRKSEARSFFGQISETLGEILGGILKGLLGSV